MAEATNPDQPATVQGIDTEALALGRRVLGREPNPDEAEALRAIFRATSQALSHGFIRRLADHVLAERSDEAVEEFFEGKVKFD
jgi:hypothetical protein